MAKLVYTAIDPSGVEHKRTSTHRVYTHTVVFKPGRAAVDHAYAQVEEAGVNAGKSYDRITNESLGIFPNIEQWRGPGVLKGWQEFAIKWRAKHPETREQTIEAARAEHLKRAQAYEAGGNWNKWHNAGWCGRLELARKLAAQQLGSVEILEVK